MKQEDTSGRKITNEYYADGEWYYEYETRK